MILTFISTLKASEVPTANHQTPLKVLQRFQNYCILLDYLSVSHFLQIFTTLPICDHSAAAGLVRAQRSKLQDSEHSTVKRSQRVLIFLNHSY